MAKLDEDFFNQLEFGRKEQYNEENEWAEVVIYCTYKGIYRQFAFPFNKDVHDVNDLPKLEREGQRIVAWSIDKALKQMNDNS